MQNEFSFKKLSPCWLAGTPNLAEGCSRDLHQRP